MDAEDKPPNLNSNQNNTEFHIPSSRDLLRTVIGCGFNPESRYHFGNLVWSGILRRDSLLETYTIDK